MVNYPARPTPVSCLRGRCQQNCRSDRRQLSCHSDRTFLGRSGGDAQSTLKNAEAAVRLVLTCGRTAARRFQKHLAQLQREGSIAGWYDRDIGPVLASMMRCERELAEADIFVACVSPTTSPRTTAMSWSSRVRSNAKVAVSW
jgi:hypothetical protein